jgi:hypothetical protein
MTTFFVHSVMMVFLAQFAECGMHALPLALYRPRRPGPPLPVSPAPPQQNQREKATCTLPRCPCHLLSGLDDIGIFFWGGGAICSVLMFYVPVN